MPIQFACACGRQLRVSDDNAGKWARCPGCGVANQVPAPNPVEYDVEVVEEDPPQAVRPAPAAKAKALPSDVHDDARKPAKGKKKKRRSSRREEGPLSQMYMAQAREEERRDAARARAAGSWDRDEDGGRTMFGIHVTAGVLAGAGMLFVGLLAMAIIAIFRDEIVIAPRLFIAAIIGTTIGGITLIKSLFFGEED
jgi:hypothetical protein